MVSTNLTAFHTVIVIVFSNDVVQNKRKKNKFAFRECCILECTVFYVLDSGVR